MVVSVSMPMQMSLSSGRPTVHSTSSFLRYIVTLSLSTSSIFICSTKCLVTIVLASICQFFFWQVEFDELEESCMLATTIAWDNALLWTWEKAVGGLQATIHQVIYFLRKNSTVSSSTISMFCITVRCFFSFFFLFLHRSPHVLVSWGSRSQEQPLLVAVMFLPKNCGIFLLRKL